MHMLRLMRSLLRVFISHWNQPGHSRRRRRLLELEHLEDRQLLSAMTLNPGSSRNADLNAKVKFKGTCTGGTSPINFVWDFDDGTSAKGSLIPTHSFSKVGKFHVTLTATDADGDSVQKWLNVTVKAAKSKAAALTVNPGYSTTADEGAIVNFSGSISGGSGTVSYVWDFADGTTDSSSLTPSHIFQDNAVYHVTLTATDSVGTSVNKWLNVTVNNVAPTAAINNAPAEATVTKPITLTATATDPSSVDTSNGFTYSWTVTKNGATYATGSAADLTFTPDYDTSYVVSLTATDKDGGAGTTTQTILADISPAATLVANAGTDQTVNAGATLIFAGSVTGGTSPYTYAWDFGDSSTSTGSLSPSHVYDTAGSYTATLNILDNLGFSSQSSIAVKVNQSTDGLLIPFDHPRIWWTPTRLDQAKTWYATHSLSGETTGPWKDALLYVLTGDSTNAQNAIQQLKDFTIADTELAGVASDHYRWADWFPVTFDWVHDAMTADDRDAIITKFNDYTDQVRQKSWGGPKMPGNNYFWGYLRNELNWAIATYHENSMAQTFLDDALITRWKDAFLPYASDEAQGGVAPEGSQYGRYMLEYPVVAATTSGLLGRDLYSETNFDKEAAINLIYATTPSKTAVKDSEDTYYQVFPFGDDETGKAYPTAGSFYLGDFMTSAALEWPNTSIGQYARNWLNSVNPSVSDMVAAVDSGGTSKAFSTLPVDYYAPGPDYFYTRNQWGSQATSIMLQLGVNKGASHQHPDSGTFQIWRNGNWLSKESTGYSLKLADTTSDETLAHNGIVFNGLGLANAYRDGPPEVTRLESNDFYSYAVVDLSQSYCAHKSNHPARDDHPYANKVVREFLFIKPLETMIILDRLESSSDSVPATDVVKSFLLHFPEKPLIESSNTVVGTNGDQALRLTTLYPYLPDYSIIDEGDFTGNHDASSYYQYRLQVNDKGSQDSYFINVLQARDANGTNVDASLSEDANSFTVTLNHPTLGQAVVVLNKGLSSSGGSVGYSATQTPPNQVTLLDHVQSIQVTDSGPAWGT